MREVVKRMEESSTIGECETFEIGREGIERMVKIVSYSEVQKRVRQVV